jgi:hypothetical protein
VPFRTDPFETPSMTAEKGKTRTKYIRAGMLEEVQTRIDRHRKLKELLKELSEVNWALLKAKDPR